MFLCCACDERKTVGSWAGDVLIERNGLCSGFPVSGGGVYIWHPVMFRKKPVGRGTSCGCPCL